MDGALMIPDALALHQHYKDLTLPVVIIAGDGDKVVFKRRSEQLRASISGSVLQIVKGAGHMVHHLAARQVVQAVESVSTVALAQTPANAQPGGPGRLRVIPPDAA
jgi:pimeloyl-ACP methyl ester carboxylesterase